VAIHHEFIRRRLSPGGCADLLAATIFLDAVERWL
jgi:triphosphoribosyl-dephospho-CoA synthase